MKMYSKIYVVFQLTFVSFFVHFYGKEVDAQFLFREANARVGKALESDRPCNSLLDYHDAHLKTPGIIEKYGYRLETHNVVTEDGYILQMHRIPTAAAGKPAVFLMHGVLSSSRDFVINCDRRALAFKLADAGFDTWLGNARGNTYCLNHTFLSTEDPSFWDFSQDEIGTIDTPTMIDYILNNTGLTNLSYIGMSMGNANALALLAAKPEYNSKINFWFAMGGTFQFKDTRSPLIRLLAPFSRSFGNRMTRRHNGEFFGQRLYNFLHTYLPILCRREGSSLNYHGICANFLYLNDGYDAGQIPPELFSVILGEFPARTSVKSMTQWFQWVISGDFSMFDYGPLKNLAKYGAVKPKLYDIQNVAVPVLLFWSKNDWITPHNNFEQEVADIKSKSSKAKVKVLKVNSSSWNHIDYANGRDADVLVYSHILSRLNKIYQNRPNIQT